MNTINPSTQTCELLSALADGELHGHAFGAVIEACAHDEVLASWGAYHLIGDVLRQPSLLVPCADMDFLSRLNKRLEREQIAAAAPVSVVQDAVAPVRAMPVADVLQYRGPAANDGNFKWKLLAGFASLAAVSAIAWNAAGLATSTAAPQLAQASNVQSVLVASPMGPIVRDARLEELLLAHRQLGGNSALQAPSGFLRNAAFEAPQDARR